MKKMNNKGFMLAETLIVATFLVTTLLFIYIQFNNITKTYNNSFKYNTVNGLYTAKNIIKYISTDGITELKTELSKGNVEFIDITNCPTAYFSENDYCNILIDASNIKMLLFVEENLYDLKNATTSFEQAMTDFINYIDYEKSSGYRVIIQFNDNTFVSLKI